MKFPEPEYAEKIVVGVVFRQSFAWYVTDKVYWYLDFTKYDRALLASGYNKPIAPDYSHRFDIAILNENTAQRFLSQIEDLRVPTNTLSEMMLVQRQMYEEYSSPDSLDYYLEALAKDYLNQVDADFLLRLLRKSSHPEEQAEILGILRQMGSRMPVDELTMLLLDRSATNRIPRPLLAKTLAALEEPAPIEVFIGMVQDATEEIGLRKTLAGLLCGLGERVPLEVLLAVVTDEEPAVCEAGIESLTVQGSRMPLEPILAQLGHPKWFVRKAAVGALSSAGEGAPVDPIVAALGDPNACVREAAAMAVDVLLDCFDERVPLTPLIAALQDKDVRVRESSLDVLANHPEYAPFDLVAQALDDQQPSVRCAALLVLERMRSERVPQEVFPKFSEMAALETHPSVRTYAARTLSALKGPKELGKLE